MSTETIKNLRFYDGRQHSIERDRLVRFELKSVIDRYYQTKSVDAATVLADLGPIHLDFTNIQSWATDIPDIDPKSARLFTLWGEDPETSEIIVIIRGYYILVPFSFSQDELEVYHDEKNTPCYPIAVISSFRTIYSNIDLLILLIDRIKLELTQNWKYVRKRVINSLEKNQIWERYAYSLDEIIFYSIVCPSIDRELITALNRWGFRTTGVLQIMASSEPKYDEIFFQSHLEEAKDIIYGTKKNYLL
ncbi:hypothetical protein [Candidatus Hodarchaeum mangrovi]